MRKRARKGESRIQLNEEERKRLQDLKGKIDKDDSDLMGLVYKKEEVGGKRKLMGDEEEEEVDEEGEGEEFADAANDGEDDDDDDEEEDKDGKEPDDSESNDSDSNVVSSEVCAPAGPKRSHKPVPSGYVCSACKGDHGVHWIFDCPIYLAKKGKGAAEQPTAKKSKNKGIIEPNKDKVFVSGLPFDVTKTSVMDFFSSYGSVKSLQLFCFDDTKRCKGDGIVQFEKEEEAKKAIKEGNGKEMEGRWLKIVEVKSKNKTRKGGKGGKGGKGKFEKGEKGEKFEKGKGKGKFEKRAAKRVKN
ncbi:hypothetical protein TrVE_jg12514 [Triparma verrucosa]|uniref:RRM domain-containing protein n=1 Tax=Triparma verrucosa TaxID=1606542 RepID=A0A9W7FGG4_9STRA|nr:hypothetical protein TrVE_jg12514 [Triparma verrucosa]